MTGTLTAERAARLAAAPLTYGDVGVTLDPARPAAVDRTQVLPAGTSLDTAAADLFAWQVQERAGLTVAASSPTVVPDAVVDLGFGPRAVGLVGPAVLSAPCRVVRVVDEDDRRGFVYGTLPGHPEAGEEAFLLARRPDGRVALTVRAVSRPGTWYTRVAGPVGRLVQHRITTRYLRTWG